jgi:sugar phosphate isomerase/epimerase
MKQMPGKPELIASCWTIAGDVYPGGPTEISPFDFRARVEAAAEAGFAGIGLWHPDAMAVAGRIGFPEMKRILDGNGIKYVEVEIITDWYAEGERRRHSDKVRADLLRAAEWLGADHIKVCGDAEQCNWSLPRLVESFCALCADAEGAGTRVALELMPFTNIKTIEHALDIVRGAGAKNGGLMFDIWHISRGQIPFERIQTCPKELLFWVEIDDADARPVGTLFEDTIHRRQLCGEGALGVPGFLRAIKGTGYDGPYGIEIVSEIHRRRPLVEAATRSYSTAVRQFEGLS